MNPDELIAELAGLQHKTRAICERHKEDYAQLYHPDLSPLGWHFGHCVYTENFWIRGQLLARSNAVEALRASYDPTCATKSARGECLPEHDALCRWAASAQQENMTLLAECLQHPPHDATPDQIKLMRHHFILHFLIQHHAQHLETMRMVEAQYHRRRAADFTVTTSLVSRPPSKQTTTVAAGAYPIGSRTDFLPYDNEYPPHSATIESFQIATRPVTNGEFLHFIEAGGYATPAYWSRAGWDWRRHTKSYCPALWRQDAGRRWFGADADGHHALAPDQPVWGLSHFEAAAYARYAGGRLPHEYEWESAMRCDALPHTGQVWEWCGNTFHPYPGVPPFRAFPYDGYSLPYFDGRHYVMKGGSRYTEAVIKRPSFRNYYSANKRHQFAGCRVVWTDQRHGETP